MKQIKQYVCRVRLTEEEYKRCLEWKKETGLSVSDILRLNLTESNKIRVVRRDLIALRREINYIGNNINQIAKKSNAGFFDVTDKYLLDKNMEHINELFRELNEKIGGL